MPEIENGLENQVADLGFELVDLDWAGSSVRPVLRLRVDKYDSVPGRGLTVEDCARISRELEPWLDSRESLSERYVLEVSSPGPKRPLKTQNDFERYKGKKVKIVSLTSEDGKSVFSGMLEDINNKSVMVNDSGKLYEISLSDIKKANLNM